MRAPDGQQMTVDVEDGMMHYPDDPDNTYDPDAKDETDPGNTGTTPVKTGGSADPQTQHPHRTDVNDQEPNSEKSEEMEQARLGRGIKRVRRMQRNQLAKAAKDHCN